MDQPKELRLQVFEKMFVATRVAIPVRGYDYIQHLEKALQWRQPVTFMTSRQLRKETLPISYRETQFFTVITNYNFDNARKWLEMIGEENRARLRYLWLYINIFLGSLQCNHINSTISGR
jgi:hypothetical protein